MKELVLTENNPQNYVIESLPDGTMFIHDIETGKNFFDQESISKLLGLPQSNVSYHLNQFKARRTNTKNLGISLEVLNSDKPVEFHPFRAVTYVAYKSKSPEAEDYLDYLEDALDTKFNRKNGFTKDWDPEYLENNMQFLAQKANHEKELANQSTTKKEDQEHIDNASKYMWEHRKRKAQYTHANRVINRAMKDARTNQRGELTESGDRPVFVPEPQLTLDDFNHIKTDKEVALVPKTKKIQSKIDKWMDSNTNKSFSELAANVDRRREKQAVKKQRRLAKKNIKSQVTLI